MKLEILCTELSKEVNKKLQKISKEKGVPMTKLLVEYIKTSEKYYDIYLKSHKKFPTLKEELKIYKNTANIIVDKYKKE